MGLCCSSPAAVTDGGTGQQQRAGVRFSAEFDDEAAQQGKPNRHNNAKGNAVKGPGSMSVRASATKPILDCFDDVKDYYAFDKVLGKGQFGVTRLVSDLATGEQCACKSISKRKLVSQEDMEDVRREIKVMHHLSGHPHVVSFKGGECQQEASLCRAAEQSSSCVSHQCCVTLDLAGQPSQHTCHMLPTCDM